MQQRLDVKRIVRPILINYNEHVLELVRLLDKISFSLVYIGPKDIRHHIRDKTVYACSIKSCTTTKTIKSIFPVMIGSRLDACIRKMGIPLIEKNLQGDGLIDGWSFDTVDIAVTLFIINGCVKHLPYFFTNDPTNCHVVSNSIVCCYTYDAQDRGKKLSLYVDNVDNKYKRGDQIVSLNDGTENTDVHSFFDHCPYPVRQDIYLTKLYREGPFDIDHLANKMIVSPGHLFLKLFLKYLYQPLREKNWSLLKSKVTIVVKSIESGNLLHVLSRKTVYHKESKSTAKMVQTPCENHRELGMNGEVYIEKNSGCYREVKMQTYPLIPYMSHLVVRQISNKVRSLIPFHPSYIGFFCYLGLMDMKNLGRTQMMTKHSFISTREDLTEVYNLLSLCYADSSYYVVVNEACIPVTETCFHSIRLETLKEKLLYIECYQDDHFIYIRYKAGLFFIRLGDLWVTPRDELFWAQKLYGVSCKDDLIVKFGFDYLISHHVLNMNALFNHNMFAKNLLGLNALKNAILATDKRYSRYFMETLTAYAKVTSRHEVVCPPIDGYSQHFVLRLPRLITGYMSLDGNNQEDCIAVREGLDVFDCYRFYTVRIKFEVEKKKSPKIVFYPVRGESEDDYLGQVVCHGSKLKTIPLSIYVRVVQVNDSQVKLFFTKSTFHIVQHILTNDRLIISMEQFHPSGMGDKLCSFHGQKGVLRKTANMPIFDNTVIPDLLVNPYCIIARLTGGQIREGWENCRDARTVHNSEGKKLVGASALYGPVYYFPIAYLSSEHIYAPTKCNIDKILGQAVKGRSRGGGMRLGNMEILNGMRGNGLASCFEEKVLEHGDRIILNDVVIPKAVHLCSEDAKAYKYNMIYDTENFFSEECEICLEKGADYRILCCKYSFHTECLKSWTSLSTKCPKCQTQL